MKRYTIEYRLHGAGEDQSIEVMANSKEMAYDTAVYEAIPEETGEFPYSAWVEKVTYKNGSEKRFNTFEGKPY